MKSSPFSQITNPPHRPGGVHLYLRDQSFIGRARFKLSVDDEGGWSLVVERKRGVSEPVLLDTVGSGQLGSAFDESPKGENRFVVVISGLAPTTSFRLFVNGAEIAVDDYPDQQGVFWSNSYGVVNGKYSMVLGAFEKWGNVAIRDVRICPSWAMNE